MARTTYIENLNLFNLCRRRFSVRTIPGGDIRGRREEEFKGKRPTKMQIGKCVRLKERSGGALLSTLFVWYVANLKICSMSFRRTNTEMLTFQLLFSPGQQEEVRRLVIVKWNMMVVVEERVLWNDSWLHLGDVPLGLVLLLLVLLLVVVVLLLLLEAPLHEVGEVALAAGLPRNPEKITMMTFKEYVCEPFLPCVEAVPREPLVLPEDLLGAPDVVADVVVEEV